MRFNKGKTVEVYTPTLSETGPHNSRKRVYPDSPTSTFKAGFAPSGQPEPHEPGRTAVPSKPTLYCRPGTVISEYDRVKIDGRFYDVDGEPDVWDNPESGRRHGVVVRLKRTAG